MDELALGLRPRPEFLGMARMFAASVARHYGCNEDCVEDVKIAISEAVTNALKAHLTSSRDDEVRLIARSDGVRLWFEVVDAGPGFDVPPSPDEVITPPQGLYEGSLGLTLIRALFPETDIVRNPSQGMTVRFAIELAAVRESNAS